MATDLAGPGYHINRSNLLVLESKADMQKRGQASPDDGDALALTFAPPGSSASTSEPGRRSSDLWREREWAVPPPEFSRRRV
jgi:phage terminase large subunit